MTEQQMQEIKKVIEHKLRLIDIANLNESDGHKFHVQLNAFKEILYIWGYQLDLDVNVYYDIDLKPSTYKLINLEV